MGWLESGVFCVVSEDGGASNNNKTMGMFSVGSVA
jgi:hypothetical protein